jgi:hypothetical protein
MGQRPNKNKPSDEHRLPARKSRVRKRYATWAVCDLLLVRAFLTAT